MIPVFNLSEKGRAVTWAEWRNRGGCNISNHEYAVVAPTLGAETQWESKGVTLCDIAGCSKVAEREIARFAIEHLKLRDLVVVEYGEMSTR